MDALIDHMIESGVLKSERVIAAFRATDRAAFVTSDLRADAYEDHPMPIGYGQTISQPTTVAFMLELLDVREGHNVLDIGSGSGWTTALLAHIVGPQGSVLGLERVEELVRFGQDNLGRMGVAHAQIRRAATELGAPQQAPFDRILVSASAHSFPRELVSQLTEGGVMVLPVQEAVWRVVRVEHQPIIDTYEGFVFVPLVTEQ